MVEFLRTDGKMKIKCRPSSENKHIQECEFTEETDEGRLDIAKVQFIGDSNGSISPGEIDGNSKMLGKAIKWGKENIKVK